MNIKYKIPFGSIKEKQYEISIYDADYAGTPIILTAGETPFTTDEDNSEEVFTPIRTITGTIQVLNKYKVGSVEHYLIDELNPTNGISNPVVLESINASNVRKVEFQGFLSCECYEQAYTRIEQYLEIGVNGILESLRYIEMQQTELFGRVKIRYMLHTALNKLTSNAVLAFNDVYVSKISNAILDKYLEPYYLFSLNKETQSSLLFDYTMKNPTAYDIVEMMAKYMGWTVKEFGKDIYFNRIGPDAKYTKYTFPNFLTGSSSSDINISVEQMINNTWMGCDHTITINRGAKKVTVNSSVDDGNLDLVETPSYNFYRGEFPSHDKYLNRNVGNYRRDYYFYFDKHGNTDGIIDYKNYLVESKIPTQEIDIISAISYFNQNYNNFINNDFSSTYSWFASFAKIHMISSGTTTEQTMNKEEKGLFISNAFYNGQQGITQRPIITLKSYRNIKLMQGRLVLKFDIYDDAWNPTEGVSDYGIFSHIVYYSLRFGNKYFKNDDNNQTLVDDIYINNISSRELNIYLGFNWGVGFVEGEVELKIYPTLISFANNPPFTLLKSVSIKYVFFDFEEGNNNVYAKIINANFGDEIGVENNVSTIKFNYEAPSLIMNSDSISDYMQTLEYNTQTNPNRVPEEDLLKRLTNYYSVNRRIINLIVDRPDVDLPNIRFSGIDDGKNYLPVSENRDWKNDKSTVTLLEIPSDE